MGIDRADRVHVEQFAARDGDADLDDLDGEILHITQAFHSALMQLEMEQYVDEELKSLARVLAEFAPQAESLSNHLRMRHMYYIDGRAQQITATLNEALG